MEKRPIASVRRDKDWLIADIAIDCDLFRMEHMSFAEEPRCWWMQVSRGERSITFSVESETPITVAVDSDDLPRGGRKGQER